MHQIDRRAAWRNTAVVGCAFLLLSWMIYYSGIRLESVRAQLPEGQELAYLPRGDVLRVAALGYDSLFADLLWLNVVQVMGEKRSEERNAEWIYQALDLVTTLDPKFDYVYQLG